MKVEIKKALPIKQKLLQQKGSHYFILCVSCMPIVCFSVCRLHSIVGSAGHRLSEKQLLDAIRYSLSQKLESYTLYCLASPP